MVDETKKTPKNQKSKVNSMAQSLFENNSRASYSPKKSLSYDFRKEFIDRLKEKDT